MLNHVKCSLIPTCVLATIYGYVCFIGPRYCANGTPSTMASLPIISVYKNCIIWSASRSFFARTSPPPPPSFARVRSLQTNTPSGRTRQSLLASRLMAMPTQSSRFAKVPLHPFSSGLEGFLNGYYLLRLDVEPNCLDLCSSSLKVFSNE